MSRRTAVPMHTLRIAFAALALAGLVSGCATYLEAKQNIAPGGAIERDTKDAKQTLEDAKRENARLQEAKTQRERELAENERRIRALENDLRDQDSALEKALQARQLTKTRYDQLKRDMDAVRKETIALGQQNDSDRLSGTSDKKADAAKEARLRDLERRKKDLEAAVAKLVKR